MTWQGTVGKANTAHRTDVVKHIDNAAGIQEPQTTPRCQDTYDSTGLDIRGGPAKVHPADLKHLPAPQGCTGRYKNVLTRTQTDATVVHDIACWWDVTRTPDASVGKGLEALAVEKGLNGRV